MKKKISNKPNKKQLKEDNARRLARNIIEQVIEIKQGKVLTGTERWQYENDIFVLIMDN